MSSGKHWTPRGKCFREVETLWEGAPGTRPGGLEERLFLWVVKEEWDTQCEGLGEGAGVARSLVPSRTGKEVSAWGHVNWEQDRKGGCRSMSGPWGLPQQLAFYPERSGRVVSRGLATSSASEKDRSGCRVEKDGWGAAREVCSRLWTKVEAAKREQSSRLDLCLGKGRGCGLGGEGALFSPHHLL